MVGPGTQKHNKNTEPFKKRTRRNEVTETTNVPSQQNEIAVSTHTNEVLWNAAFTLSIDHILDQVFDVVFETTDLLTCRIVCHRWNERVVPKLKKRICLSFVDLKLHNESRKLNKLTSLLERATTFPCTNFWFFIKNRTLFLEFLNNSSLRKFFGAHGAHLQKLSLFSHNAQEFELTESQLMKDIEHLLLDHAPNLNYLFLDVSFDIPPGNHLDGRVLRSTNKEQANSFGNAKRKNVKLKVVKLGKTASEKLLEMIFSLAPNLQKIELKDSYYNYLIEPLNRLHLIKRLFYNPKPNIENEFYDKIANNFPIENLKLRKIDADLDSVVLNAAAETKAVNVLNRLLENSWDSLEEINLSEIYVRGIRFPRLMPKVKGITIANVNEEIYEEKSMFPPGFAWSRTFPALRKLNIYWSGSFKEFMKFFKSLNIQPMQSVKKVNVALSRLKHMPKHLPPIPPYFPNARVVWCN